MNRNKLNTYRKNKIVEIRQKFAVEGYLLLSERYKNYYTKLRYECPNGHIRHTEWRVWQRGHRCPACANIEKPTINVIRAEFKLDGYELLSKNYENSKIKLRYVCPIGHKHSMSLNRWRLGRRCPTCKNINSSGQNSPFWKGGISCDPYCDAWADKEYKESIKERDGYRCLNPNCKGASQILSIHHIDYNKENCCPSNLITICRSCNTAANYGRDWHRAWYQAIMYRRYGYE